MLLLGSRAPPAQHHRSGTVSSCLALDTSTELRLAQLGSARSCSLRESSLLTKILLRHSFARVPHSHRHMQTSSLSAGVCADRVHMVGQELQIHGQCRAVAVVAAQRVGIRRCPIQSGHNRQKQNSQPSMKEMAEARREKKKKKKKNARLFSTSGAPACIEKERKWAILSYFSSQREIASSESDGFVLKHMDASGADL